MTEHTAKLDRTKNQPLYMQIREDLLQLLQKSGQPGKPFFNDKELVERYGVNRLTVRRAVDGLVDDGILYRVRGVGTFVSEPKISLKTTASRLTTFEEFFRNRNQTIRVEILRWDIQQAPEDICKYFGVEARTPMSYLKRLRCVDDAPVALDMFYFPANVRENLINTQSCIHQMAQIYNMGTQQQAIRETLEIEAMPAEKETANLLRISLTEPVLSVSISGFCEDGSMAFTGKTLHRGDMFKYSVQIPL